MLDKSTLDIALTKVEEEKAGNGTAYMENPEYVKDDNGPYIKSSKGGYVLSESPPEGVQRFRKDERGRAGTTVDAADVEEGKLDIAIMRCSTFSGWTLAAAGYDVAAQLKDKNGVGFAYHEVSLTQEKKGAASSTYVGYEPELQGKTVYEFKAPHIISGRMLIDGQPEAVHAMATIMDHHGGDLAAIEGVTVDVDVHGLKAYDASRFSGDQDGGVNLAVTGAVAAIELMGIGSEVLQTEIRPGDFAQSRDGSVSGKGHAYQIYEVVAFGAGYFGPDPTFPTPQGFAAPATKTWRDGVSMLITKTTDPANVGAVRVTDERRIEVNLNRVNDETKQADGSDDGGAGITGDRDVGGANTYYARLRESPWYGVGPTASPDGTTASVEAEREGDRPLVEEAIARGESDPIAITNSVYTQRTGKAAPSSKTRDSDSRWHAIRFGLVGPMLRERASAE